MHDLRGNYILSLNKPGTTSYGLTPFFSSCSYSEIRDETKFMHVCMLPFAGRVRTLCNLRLQWLPYDTKNDFSLEYINHRILTLN